MRTSILLFITILAINVSAQDIIQMEKYGGVYKVPCKINGLPLMFIFDTGASDVSLSLSEAVFMIKNGYLKKEDLGEKEYYSIANGEIAEGTKVVLRKVEFGKQTLYNVEATIVHSSDAPLLLGQSVLQRIGNFSVDYAGKVIIFSSTAGSINKAINSGDDITTGIINDINGREYRTVKIGNQIWMAQNLDVDKFQSGESILYAESNLEWERAGQDKVPAWCYYDNDLNNGPQYGKLYNWYATSDHKGLCPTGWRVPDNVDLTNLINYLGGINSGAKMKGAHWIQNDNFENSNESGFTGLPGGGRDSDGEFVLMGNVGSWWTSTEYKNTDAWIISLLYGNNEIQWSYNFKSIGFTVRCIRD